MPLQRSLERVEKYENEQLINLEESIIILQEAGILQLLKSVNEAKERLGTGSSSAGNSRLRL
jgi:hypothetical protein